MNQKKSCSRLTVEQIEKFEDQNRIYPIIENQNKILTLFLMEKELFLTVLEQGIL